MPPARRLKATSAMEVTKFFDALHGSIERSRLRPRHAASGIDDWLRNRMEANRKQLIETNNTEILSPVNKKYKTTTENVPPLNESKPVCLPIDIQKEVMMMKKTELQEALRQRNIDCNGLKGTLQDRLLNALHTEHFTVFSMDNNETITVTKEKADCNESTLEKREVVNDSKTERDVVNNTVAPEQSTRVSLEKSENGDSVQQRDPVSTQAKTQSKQSTEMPDVTDIPNREENNSPNGINEQMKSPTRTVPEGLVLSAIKVFSSQKAPGQKPVYELNTTKPISPGVKQPSFASKIQTSKSNQKQEKIDPVYQGLAYSIPATPACSLLCAPPGSQKGTSSLKSNKAQETMEKRMAKIAEIRSKSKSCALSAKLTLPETVMPVLSKAHVTADVDEKRRLQQEMRAKTVTSSSTLLASKTVVPIVACSPPKSVPHQNVFHNASSVLMNSSSPNKVKPSKSPLKHQPQSCEKFDTYEISDREDDESDYASESDGEQSSRRDKRIPDWALPQNLNIALANQMASDTDPDDIFGEVETCDLEAIFDRKKQRYKKRASSGNWTKDGATEKEKIAYKESMVKCRDIHAV